MKYSIYEKSTGSLLDVITVGENDTLEDMLKWWLDGGSDDWIYTDKW